MVQEPNVCKYTIDVDQAGNPVIEAVTEECKQQLKRTLEEREVVIRVRVQDNSESATT